jgi:hypothetical protein
VSHDVNNGTLDDGHLVISGTASVERICYIKGVFDGARCARLTVEQVVDICRRLNITPEELRLEVPVGLAKTKITGK